MSPKPHYQTGDKIGRRYQVYRALSGGMGEVYLCCHLIGHVTRWLVVFRVSRIQAATVTESHFERQPDFDLTAFWQTWCADMVAQHPPYPVTLRVRWEAIPLLPQRLGERANLLLEQAGPPNAEGAVMPNLTFESFEAARSQVLGFGPGVEVLEPAELRARVIEQATQIVGFYASKATAIRSED